jgi:hypothetical protein
MNITTTLQTAEEARRTGMLSADTAQLRALFAPSLTYVHSNGASDTRESYLAKLDSGSMRYQSLQFEDAQFEVIGTLGLVRARMTAEVMREQTLRTIASTYLAVWYLDGNNWQLHAVQGSPLLAI